MTDNIQIKGMDHLVRKITTLEQMRRVKATMSAAAVDVKGKISGYPPLSAANQPGPYPKRWYQRGYGPRYARADGSVGGHRTSETLGKKWTTRSKNYGLTQIIGNNTSYGPYVQGDKQAAFHKRRGWKTTAEVISENAARIVKMIRSEIQRIINS